MRVIPIETMFSESGCEDESAGQVPKLDLPLARVSIVQGHTDQTINMGGASGSTGIWKGGVALRAAAAEARRVLVDMAAEKLGVPAGELRTEDGRVIARDGKALVHFVGSVEGRILDAPSGAEGFGYDPLFAPQGYDRSFAELGAEIKNSLSHRGRALAQVVAWLQQS